MGAQQAPESPRAECPARIAPLVRVLGFAVQQASIVWYEPDAVGVLRQRGTVRPATPQEVALWMEYRDTHERISRWFVQHETRAPLDSSTIDLADEPVTPLRDWLRR